MKKYSLIVCLCLSAFACQQTEKVEVASPEMEMEAIELALIDMKNMLMDPTEVNLIALTHEDLTYGHSGGKIEDREEFMRVLLSGENDYKSFLASEQEIHISGKTAWVRHIMDATVGVGEEDVVVHLNVLTLWIKTDGSWKLYARQAVVV